MKSGVAKVLVKGSAIGLLIVELLDSVKLPEVE